MNHKVLRCALFMVLLGVLPLQRGAAAAETEEGSDTYTLGEIVVSGKRDGVEASQTVYTVTAEDIRNKNARTLDQAISLLPGVNIRVGGEGVPRIDIRGFRTRHVLLLLNGVPLNSAFDQQFDPTIIPTENIAEIKLTAGASSVLYGQGGLGGVINIITKKGTKGLHGVISGETGDHEPYLARASISGGKDKIDYFLSGSSSKVNGFPLSGDFTPTGEQGSGYRNNSDRERNNVFGNLGFTPTKDLLLGLSFSYTEGSFGKPSSVTNDPFDPFASPPKYERIDHFEGFSVQAAGDYAVTDRLSLRGWAFMNQLKQNDNLYDNGNFNSFNLVAGSFQERVTTSINGVSLQPKYDLGKAGGVTLALAGEWDSWKNDGLQTTAPNTFAPVNADKSLAIYSAAVEYEVSPLQGLGLVAGYGYYWQARNELTQDDYSLLAGAHYDLFADTRLRASFKRNIRFPSLGDLYDLTQGNPNLVPEVAYTYEGGVDQKLPLNSVVRLTGYYTDAKNLIQNDQVAGRFTNLAEVRFTGVEVAAATQCVRGLFLRASYTYLNAEDKSRAGRDQLQYSPRDKVAMEGKYDFDFGLSPYLSILYVGNQYFYTKNSITPVQKAKLNDYTLVNVKLSQRLVNNIVTLYVGVDNLFDQNYETSYGFPQAGRFIYGGVELRL
ncbi:MAG: TonB-dependent receptor [Thermodesulfobacteriota bacterium]|jgi:outer membrane cobalamin receptor